MELNEELVALVTQKVLETLRAGEAAPAAPRTDGLLMTVRDGEEAKPGVTPDEVVIGVAPAFALSQVKTIGGLPHADVLRELSAGIEEEGLRAGLSASATSRTCPSSPSGPLSSADRASASASSPRARQ